MPCLTIADLNKLGPCSDSGRRVRASLRKISRDQAHCFTAAEAKAAGCTLDDIVWAASSVAITNKVVERKLRLWMADCAARVLHIYERDYPADARVRKAIRASRDYANGRIGAAAWDAARAAARDAARAAARDAAWAAAWDAARDAAWAAAWAAARAAARAAAWDAARAAARDAARAAARDAARAAARDAEEQFQFDRLILWLSGDEPKPLRLPAKPKSETQRLAA